MTLMVRLMIDFLLDDEAFHEEMREILFGYEFPNS